MVARGSYFRLDDEITMAHLLGFPMAGLSLNLPLH